MTPRERLTLGAGIAALAIGVGIASCPHTPAGRPVAPEADRQSLIRSQAVETWTRLDEIVRPCDAAVAAAGTATPPPSDPRVPPGPARDAGARCRSASLRLLGLKPAAEFDGAAHGEIGRALERCQFLYAVEGNAHVRLATALEAAGASPVLDKRALFEAWAEAQEADIAALGCRIGVMAAARGAGLPIDLFRSAAGAPTAKAGA